MKLIKRNTRLVVVIIILLLISLILYGAYSVASSGNRWFASSINQSLRTIREDVIPGRIYDRNGIQLAGMADGQRVYHQDVQTRSALSHVIGTRDGVVKNGIETFMSYLLYAYDDSYITRLSAAFSGQKRHGYDIRLSIDSNLSRLISQYFPAEKSGAVVVMNYRTGEILALNSFPNFDPMGDMAVVVRNPEKPYLNLATQWRSAPGSTYKVVTMASALQYLPGASSKNYTCTGAYQVEDATITEASMAKHGELDLQKALAVSCNIIFAKIALEVGDEQLKKTSRSFGLDDYFLFSDLVVENSKYPGENRVYKEIAWTGAGQSALMITPMHMCLIASAIANEGEMMEPKLLLQAVDQNRTGRAQLSPRVYRTALSREDADTIARAMRQAVLSGTANKAAVKGLEVCGKTGSAQIDGQKETNAWFIGFIDEKTLPYSVCIVVKDAGSGSRVAAPIAGEIFSYIHRMR
jgi:peptidoglycan glycosyltransferase